MDTKDALKSVSSTNNLSPNPIIQTETLPDTSDQILFQSQENPYQDQKDEKKIVVQPLKQQQSTQQYGLDSVIQEAATEEENTTYEFKNVATLNHSSSFSNDQNQKQPISISKVYNILQKPFASRSNTDLLQVHQYFSTVNHNKFFCDLEKDKGLYEVLGLYKSITLETYQSRQFVFHFGERGQFFYIVLKGTVSVQVPTEKTQKFDDYFQMMKFIIECYDSIMAYKDNHSKILKKFLDLIGLNAFSQNNIQSIEDMHRYLRELINQREEIKMIREINMLNGEEIDPKKDKLLYQQDQFLVELSKQLQIQCDRPNHTFYFTLLIDLLEPVATLQEGLSFGELALIADKPRIATIQAIENGTVLGVISKNDYKKYIGDSFTQKMEKCISGLQKYLIFQKISIRKMQDLFYFIKERNFIRHTYVFKEGDQVDGIYFIVNGEVQKLKSEKSLQKFGRKKNLIMSIIEGSEIIGLDEIIEYEIQIKQNYQAVHIDKSWNKEIQKRVTRKHSIQVVSEKATLMFFSLKDFKQRVLRPYPALFKELLQHHNYKNAFYSQRQDLISSQKKTQQINTLKTQLTTLNKSIEKPILARSDLLSIEDCAKFQSFETQAKNIYNKGGMSDQNLLMIQQAIQIDRLSCIQKTDQEPIRNMNQIRKLKKKLSLKELLLNPEIYKRSQTPTVQQKQSQSYLLTPQKGEFLHQKHIIPDVKPPGFMFVNDPAVKQQILSSNDHKHGISNKQTLKTRPKSRNSSQKPWHKNKTPIYLDKSSSDSNVNNTEQQIDKNLAGLEEVYRSRQFKTLKEKYFTDHGKQGPLNKQPLKSNDRRKIVNLMYKNMKESQKNSSHLRTNHLEIKQEEQKEFVSETKNKGIKFMDKLYKRSDQYQKSYFTKISDKTPRLQELKSSPIKESKQLDYSELTRLKTQFEDFITQQHSTPNYEQYDSVQGLVTLKQKITQIQTKSKNINLNVNSNQFKTYSVTPVKTLINQDSNHIFNKQFSTQTKDNSHESSTPLQIHSVLNYSLHTYHQMTPNAQTPTQNSIPQQLHDFNIIGQQNIKNQYQRQSHSQTPRPTLNLIPEQIPHSHNTQNTPLISEITPENYYLLYKIYQVHHDLDGKKRSSFKFTEDMQTNNKNQKNFEQLYSFKRIQELIPVEKILPESPLKYQKKRDFEMKRLEIQHSKDLKRIQQRLDAL